jgi:hypothetical protein
MDGPWKKIVPLKTNCQTFKQVFQVERCDFPISHYDFTDFDVMITFSSGKDERQTPKGTVTNAVIIFKKLVKLSEIEENLETYETVPISDLPGEVNYVNRKKGISFNLLEIDGEKFIRSLALSPPVDNATQPI